MKPELFLRLPGERKDFKLLITDHQGLYKFAVGTNQPREIILNNIEVHFNRNIIEVLPLDSADIFHLDFSEIKDYSYKLAWTGEQRLFPKALEGFAFNYIIKDTAGPIQLLIRIRSQVAPWGWNFPVNLFSTQPIVQDFPIALGYRNTSSMTEFDIYEIRRLFLLYGETIQFGKAYSRHTGGLVLRSSSDSAKVNINTLP